MRSSEVVVPWYRRTLVHVSAAAVLVLAMGLVGWLRLSQPTVTFMSTAPGQQLTLTLEDGSRVTLNTRSKLEARMTRSHRTVRLLEGEAFFDVARDQLRPFVVETRIGSVRAVGTRFDLLLDERHLEVNMEEGRVLIRSASSGGLDSMAEAGVRATLVAGSTRATLGSADVNRVENWRLQRIEFDRVPLGEALKEFSRYTSVPIRVGSGNAGRILISAVLKTGDVAALRATLNGAFGLRIVERGGELVVMDGEKL